MPALVDPPGTRNGSDCSAAGLWRRTVERIAFGTVLLAIIAFYGWSARNEETSWQFGQRQTDYYNLLVEGMLAGHVSLNVDVPPELLALADPYNPATRPPGLGLHDVSFFRGKYYLYFGPAPIVTLMLPFRALTGIGLPLPLAVLIFASAGYVVSASLWGRIRREYFPGASTIDAMCALVALGTVSVAPLLVRRGNIWELPLSGGYFFSSVAVASVYAYLHASRRNLWWLAIASMSLGLAVASRPTYLYAAGLLILPMVYACRRGIDRTLIATVIAAVAPIGCVGLALAAYNYARFGNPLEFGVAYQFSGIYEATARHFSWSYVPFNLRLYGIAPLEWSRYFPFLHAAEIPAGPAGHVGVENPCGIVWHMPIVWAAMAAPLAWRARTGGERARLKVWIAAVAALAAGPLTALVFFYAVIGRYEADFMPAVALMAAVGVLAIERDVRHSRRAAKYAVSIVMGATALVSAGFMVLFSLYEYGMFQRYNSHAYVRLARWSDYPAYWLQKITRPPLGPIELEVQFPSSPKIGREPIVSVGPYHDADYVFVEYDGASRARFGYAHDFGGQMTTDWITVPPGSSGRLRIEMGALYPPEEYPAFRGIAVEQVAAVTRRLAIALNGRVLLDAYRRFHATDPAHPRIGRDKSEFGSAFTGRIVSVRRDERWLERVLAGGKVEQPTLHGLSGRFSGLAMNVTLPSQRVAGAREPIITTGESGRADFFYVEYLDATHVRFGLEHWGKAGIFSPAIEWVTNQPRRLDVSLGSFPAPDRTGALPSDRAWVELDGITVWSTPAKFYPVEAADVAVGRNPVGGSACMARFTGTISDVRPMANPPPKE